MRKVLVDRELLSVLRSCTLAWAAEYQWRNNLREIHDDHKDAVERVEAILAKPDDQASSETSLDTPLMIQRLGNRNKRIDELEASLSAATAERDRLRKELERNQLWHKRTTDAGAICMRERDQLRAEIEALRPIHAMILNALDRDAEEGKTARGEMAAELRAAMAAKEA